MYSTKKQSGFTIVESILVLIIGMSIIYLSLRQYQTWQRDSEMRQVQYNVDALFAAMTAYYQGHCADPNHSLGQRRTDPFPVAISTLISEGYFSANQLRYSSLVDGATPADGYIVQFNPSTPYRTVRMSDNTSHNMGYIVNWRAQVAADLNLTSHYATELKNGLLADCLSNLNGSFVTPCNTATSGGYAVWERSISLPSSEGNSNMWMTRPRAQLFKQLYTTYPVLNSADTNQWSTIGSDQLFTCVN